MARVAPREWPNKYFFVELFSGCEVWSNTLRKRGYAVYSFDTLQGESGNVLRPSVARLIGRLLASGGCLGVLAGVPCTSFSIAAGRRRPMRSKSDPLGLPGLPPNMQEKIQLGNQLLAAAMKFFRICHKYRVPFLWESPATSYQWHTPGAVAMDKWPGVEDVITHYCGWGTRWRKATRFRCFMLPTCHELVKKCRSRNGICSFSQKHHITLEGKDPNGLNWTARAAAYPQPLATQMGHVFEEAAFFKVFADLAGN